MLIKGAVHILLILSRYLCQWWPWLAADDLVMKGAQASAAGVLTYFYWEKYCVSDIDNICKGKYVILLAIRDVMVKLLQTIS